MQIGDEDECVHIVYLIFFFGCFGNFSSWIRPSVYVYVYVYLLLFHQER